MPNNTDKAIKKALEYCDGSFRNCYACPYEHSSKECWSLEREALALINRQEQEKQNLEIELKAMRGAANSYKAEVERLNTYLDVIGYSTDKIKAEAYKEFADKFKKKLSQKYTTSLWKVYCEEIDNLLNELVGDENGN